MQRSCEGDPTTAVQESAGGCGVRIGRASAVEGVVACCGIRKAIDDRTSYCETKKGRDATWDICKGQRNRDLDAAWKIGARILAVKTGKELGAFNKEVPADRISHDTTPQPMLL